MTQREISRFKRAFSAMVLAVSLSVATLFGPLRAADAGVFNPETFTLANGMQVVVVSNHRVPVVTHMVWYKVGSADEQPGQSGAAHFFEHLMFKGTENRAPGEFSRLVSKNGGRENAFTSYDFTAYFQTIAREHLELMMELEADRMTNLTLTDAIIEPERQVVLEERRSRTDNNPGSILHEQVQAAAFLNYPYRRPVIGWKHEIEALTKDELLKFYKRWYAPNNAILVVAGDITAAELKPLAEKYYGKIPANPDIDRPRTAEPPQSTPRRLTLKDPRVRQPSWGRVYIAPSFSYGETQHAYALQVLSEILGGGGTSRLYRELVIDNQKAVGAGSYYRGDDLGPSQFGFYASPRPGVSMDVIESAVEAEITKVMKDGVTQDEVTRAIKRLQAQAIYARDSFSAGPRVLGSALAVGRKIEDIEAWPERIGAVTPEAIQKAAQHVFQLKGSVTSLLLPPDKPASKSGDNPKAELKKSDKQG